MTILAEVICDSTTDGRIWKPVRLTTLRLRYPRFIHPELLTHRVFSRNASSSRAIPVEWLIQGILDDTAMPMHWGKNQPGMQAKEEHEAVVRLNQGGSFPFTREEAWLVARNNAISVARGFAEAGYHKQIVNRLLEPFSHITVLVSSTEWNNFMELRDHPDAQPEIMVLAQAMKKALAESTPRTLKPGEWHLPFITGLDTMEAGNFVTTEDQIESLLIKASVARCARTSYFTHEGKPPNIENDLKLYERLVGARPLHASPAEHQATPDKRDEEGNWRNIQKHGNFSGWQQFRKILEDEYIKG